MFQYLVKLMSLIALLFALVTKAESDVTEHVEAAISPYVEHHAFSGVILVAERGRVVFNKSYGMANQEWGVRNTLDTKFRIASMTKSFTALLIMQLIEEEKLSLDAKLSDYLPVFNSENAKKITIRDLLGHRSGLPNHFAIPGWSSGDFRKTTSKQHFIAEIAKLDLLFSPGSQYHYSNSGYFLLGSIIESITGETFEQVLGEKILKPTEMTNSGIEKAGRIIKKRAQGYQVSAEGGYQNEPYFNMDVFGPGAAMYSTAPDLLKWDQALYANELIGESHKKYLFSEQNHFGWRIGSKKLPGVKKEIMRVEYDGQIAGFSSMLTRFTTEQITVILLANNGASFQDKQHLTDEIASAFFGGQSLSVNTKLPISLILRKAIMDGQLDETLAYYQQDTNGSTIERKRVAELAYQLQWSGQTAAAIKVIKFNAERFTQSSSAQLHLAEILFESGNSRLAHSYYVKALRAEPEGANSHYIRQKIDSTGLAEPEANHSN